MERENLLRELFQKDIDLNHNLILFQKKTDADRLNQNQTKDIFTNKWGVADKNEEIEKLYAFQQTWFLNLYGFNSEEHFRNFLQDKQVILDAGCGLGYKSAWFASLAPHAIVIGIDISDAVFTAATNYANVENLFFLQGDIVNTGIKANKIDFTVCDQVIMHTEVPEVTFKHLSEVTTFTGDFACYVYSKKALPRELIDTFFRSATHDISKDDMWDFSSQLTELGKRLSELNVSFECPAIPILGIKAGTYDIQRFIYWNFLKCFWKEDWGFELSRVTNFDWYAPSNAKRFSKEEFLKMGSENNMELIFIHEEEACYSGRFKKINVI